MIPALGFPVEYEPGAFGDDEGNKGRLVTAIKFVQSMPKSIEPALSVLFVNLGELKSGPELALSLTVVVRNTEVARSEVVKFLDRFEGFYLGDIDRQYRTIDGAPAP